MWEIPSRVAVCEINEMKWLGSISLTFIIGGLSFGFCNKEAS